MSCLLEFYHIIHLGNFKELLSSFWLIIYSKFQDHLESMFQFNNGLIAIHTSQYKEDPKSQINFVDLKTKQLVASAYYLNWRYIVQLKMDKLSIVVRIKLSFMILIDLSVNILSISKKRNELFISVKSWKIAYCFELLFNINVNVNTCNMIRKDLEKVKL